MGRLAKDQLDVDHLDVRGGGGRLSILLMKIVVITSMVVRLTLKAASKKKVMAKVIAVNRRVGKYMSSSIHLPLFVSKP